jgi:hypothetical protein
LQKAGAVGTVIQYAQRGNNDRQHGALEQMLDGLCIYKNGTF